MVSNYNNHNKYQITCSVCIVCVYMYCICMYCIECICMYARTYLQSKTLPAELYKFLLFFLFLSRITQLEQCVSSPFVFVYRKTKIYLYSSHRNKINLSFDANKHEHSYIIHTYVHTYTYIHIRTYIHAYKI